MDDDIKSYPEQLSFGRFSISKMQEGFLEIRNAIDSG